MSESVEYLIQYVDDAKEGFDELSEEAQELIRDLMRDMAKGDPRLLGEPQDGMEDRVLLRKRNVSVLVWISEDVRVLTVVQVREVESLVAVHPLADLVKQ